MQNLDWYLKFKDTKKDHDVGEDCVNEYPGRSRQPIRRFSADISTSVLSCLGREEGQPYTKRAHKYCWPCSRSWSPSGSWHPSGATTVFRGGSAALCAKFFRKSRKNR